MLFCCLLIFSLNLLFQKATSGSQTLDLAQADIVWGLIWVQAGCKGYWQTPEASKYCTLYLIETLWRFCKQSRPRSGSSCNSCLIRVHSVCILRKYDLFDPSQVDLTGPRSAVGNVPGYRCMSDCRSRGRKFDPGPVPYFRGDGSWNNFYGHSPPFRWFIQEGLLSVTSESMRTNYWLTACSSLPRKKCG